MARVPTIGVPAVRCDTAAPGSGIFARIARSYPVRTFVRYISNPNWLCMYLFGRFNWARWIALKFARRATIGAATLSPLFPRVRADEFAATIARDGYCGGLALPSEALQQVLRFAQAHRCYPDRDTTQPFLYRDLARAQQRRTEPILIGRYYNTARDCPAIARLQSDPLLWEIAAKYLRARPVHIGNRLWWSFVNRGTELDRVRAGQGFHYDLDDWRTVTFFFYLTEVDAHAGPHVLVRGSHRRKPLRWLMSIYKSRSEAQLVRCYGDDAFVTLTGPAGFGFAEDLFCYHRGAAPSVTDRLILQIRFGLRDYGNANDVLVTS